MATRRTVNDVEAQAAYLYARLYAPCCWAQTLDVHYSPIVNELKAEIRNRLEAGVSQEDIVDSLVKQYGARIVATQPQTSTATLLFAGAALLGSFPLLFLIQRRRRLKSTVTTNETANAIVTAPVSLHLQDKLDEELDKVDG